MSEKKEVIIKFKNVHTQWRYDLTCGGFNIGGYGETLEEAEKRAFSDIDGIPNHGIVHTMYENGKSTKVEIGNIKDAMVVDTE